VLTIATKFQRQLFDQSTWLGGHIPTKTFYISKTSTEQFQYREVAPVGAAFTPQSDCACRAAAEKRAVKGRPVAWCSLGEPANPCGIGISLNDLSIQPAMGWHPAFRPERGIFTARCFLSWAFRSRSPRLSGACRSEDHSVHLHAHDSGSATTGATRQSGRRPHAPERTAR
jgi:hypothetical protein